MESIHVHIVHILLNHFAVDLRRPESKEFNNVCTEKASFLMQVRLPGYKVGAVEVLVTSDPIKLIKPQLMIMVGWSEKK